MVSEELDWRWLVELDLADEDRAALLESPAASNASAARDGPCKEEPHCAHCQKSGTLRNFEAYDII